MARELFGTDGIRGPAGIYPLDEAGCEQIGKAIGTFFGKPGDSILVGSDPRESSPQIVQALIKGLNEVGINTQDLGVIPTPGLAYLTKSENVVAGVMVTASHNPFSDNGIKIFSSTGGKLDDDVETNLNKLIESDISSRDLGTNTGPHGLIEKYKEYLIQTVSGQLNGLKLAIDSANGATSVVAGHVFSQLNTQTNMLFDKPDGRNINVECGATDTRYLQKYVIEKNLEAGAAFDGDGDRLMLIDHLGRQLSGDHILYILAVAGHHPGVVATIMSNMGLENALKLHGIEMIRVNVGDRYVLEGLEKSGWRLGGEQSGHIILTDYSTTGDGILAAIQTLKLVQESGKSLAEWYDELKLLPQAIVNLEVKDKSILDDNRVKQFIIESEDDLGNNGRLNIRPSGTEPKIRIMVESEDAVDRANSISEQLDNLLSTMERNK